MLRNVRFWILVVLAAMLFACSSPFAQPTVVETSPPDDSQTAAAAPTENTPAPSPTVTLTRVIFPTATQQITAAATTDPHPGWQTYRSNDCRFEIRYPPDAVLSSEGGVTRIDLPLIPGTNLQEKYLIVTCYPDAAVCADPLAAGFEPGFLASEERTFNGIQFTVQSASEGAMGSVYEWTAYSTQRVNTCASLGFVLHSTNRMNYPTPPPEFDRAAESAMFEEIVSTFTWLMP